MKQRASLFKNTATKINMYNTVHDITNKYGMSLIQTNEIEIDD